MGFNVFVNLFKSTGIKHSVFTIYVIIRAIEEDQNVFAQATFEFLAYSFEILLICYTTYNIDYVKYIYFLLVGVSKSKMIVRISIFLLYIPDNDLSSSNGTVSIRNSGDISDDEEFKKRLDDYDRQSSTGHHRSTAFDSNGRSTVFKKIESQKLSKNLLEKNPEGLS